MKKLFGVVSILVLIGAGVVLAQTYADPQYHRVSPVKVDRLWDDLKEVANEDSAKSFWTMDSLDVDTSVVYRVNPKAVVTSAHKVVHTDNVMDYKVVMERSIVPDMGRMGSGWVRFDSVTITDTITTFKYWNTVSSVQYPIGANFIRFIFDPVDANYVPADTLRLLGIVMSSE